MNWLVRATCWQLKLAQALQPTGTRAGRRLPRCPRPASLPPPGLAALAHPGSLLPAAAPPPPPPAPAAGCQQARLRLRQQREGGGGRQLAGSPLAQRRHQRAHHQRAHHQHRRAAARPGRSSRCWAAAAVPPPHASRHAASARRLAVAAGRGSPGQGERDAAPRRQPVCGLAISEGPVAVAAAGRGSGGSTCPAPRPPPAHHPVQNRAQQLAGVIASSQQVRGWRLPSCCQAGDSDSAACPASPTHPRAAHEQSPRWCDATRHTHTHTRAGAGTAESLKQPNYPASAARIFTSPIAQTHPITLPRSPPHRRWPPAPPGPAILPRCIDGGAASAAIARTM